MYVPSVGIPTVANRTLTVELLEQFHGPHSTLTRNRKSVVSTFHTWTSPTLEPVVVHS